MSLFSSTFYKYFTKYTKLIAQKKQLARILEILGKLRPFLLKKRAFSRKMGAVMPLFEVTDQKKLERKEWVKLSSILEDTVKSAVTFLELCMENVKRNVWNV